MNSGNSFQNRRTFLKVTSLGALLGSTGSLPAEDSIKKENPLFADLPQQVSGKVNQTSGHFSDDLKTFHETGRALPVADKNEVIVCGGGPAGIAAALASARAGADTRLLEVNGCLGGIWTAGLLTKILDASHKSGIMQEILEIMETRGSDVARKTKGTTYDPELMKLVLEELCVEAGVKIQLKTRIVGAVTDSKNRLIGVITESKSGRQVWKADRFVDCTGDGDLAAHAGCEFKVGCDEECSCQPMSMLALLTGPEPEAVKKFLRDVTGPDAKRHLLKEMQSAGIDPSYHAPTLRHLHSGLFSIMTNHEYSVSAFDADAITKATIHARAETHEIVNALRKKGGVWKDLAVVATAERIGVREGRRIKGRYEITVDDVLAGASHEDSIAKARFPVDIHSVFKENGKTYYGAPKGQKAKPYDIPLRALIAADVDGLMLAGRCISGDFIAHASYRVTGNSVPMGEVAGRCSAVSIKQGVMPHEVSIKDVLEA